MPINRDHAYVYVLWHKRDMDEWPYNRALSVGANKALNVSRLEDVCKHSPCIATASKLLSA